MADFSFFKWFKNVSIAKKLYAVVGIMAVLIAVELGTLYFAVNTLSSVRAFVGAEGLWSKSQKDAVYHLRKYYRNHQAVDEQEFYNFMKVPFGYHKTLLELKKKSFNMGAARQGFLEGGSHPDDIDGMIKLFRRFNNISYIHKSVNIWTEGDSVIAKLIPIAEKLHVEINSPSPSQIKLDEIIKEIDLINQKLTKLENDFSYTLGEGARWLENTIFKLLLGIALTVEFSGLILTYFVVRGITKGLKEIRSASKRIAEKDFSAKAQVFSNDEIGVLATSFNEMTAELSNSIQQRIRADQDLELKTNYIQEHEKRIEGILDALIQATQLNFTEKLVISDRGDELDAIAVGLNTMSEELEFHLQQLEQSEYKLNDAQRLAHIGSWDWNIVDNTIAWSDELFRIFGVSRENFVANFENYLKCIHPDDREYVNGIVQKAYQDHQPLDFFHRLILPDGEERTLHGRGQVYVNNGGNIIRMMGTAQDITEQNKAEKKIIETAGQMQTIIHNAPHAVIIINEQGAIINWSLQAEQVFGWKAEEVLDKPMHDIIMPACYREGHLRGFNHFLSTGEGPILGKTLELSALRKNKEEFPIDLRITTTRLENKPIFIAFINDISDRKKQETAIRKNVIELERKNSEIAQFAYAASHDLQEPLRSISNFSTLLAQKLEKYSDKEVNEYMSLVTGGVNRMSKLIFDLLEYSRIGKDMEKRAIDCDKLVHEILTDLAAIIEESGAEIYIEKLPVIECYDLKSVFQNLILNAIKFKKTGVSPVINISATDTGKEYLFAIEDNGIGIEKAYYERIFIIFQRLHLRTEYAGTGIGLSLTKKIVEMHGGKIWVESEFGTGTTLYFTIPKS